MGVLGPRDTPSPTRRPPQREATLLGLPWDVGLVQPTVCLCQDKAVAEPVSRLLESALRAATCPARWAPARPVWPGVRPPG